MKHSFLLALAVTAMPVMAEEIPENISQQEPTDETGAFYEKYNIESAELDHQPKHIDMENGVLGIADDRGFTLQSKNGKFVFKPYLFLQTRAIYNY